MGKEIPKIIMLGEMCCGCGACAARCPKNCIKMEPDGCGFLHPLANLGECIGCGACDSVCPSLEKRQGDGIKNVLWAKSKDMVVRLSSSSGGIFALLARKVLAENGVVCGAAWDGDCRHVRHILVESEGELDRVMRSKYTQSSIGREVYESVLKALRLGRRVLFAGTACQVAGLKAYLGKMAEATYLYTVDVVCHGVPSPLLWENWVEYREECTGAMLREVNMRDKATGWLSYSVVYRYNAVKDGFAVSDSCVAVNDWYFKAFLNNASLRSSCFSCSSKRSCGSDVTLGDFWGFQDLYPNIDSSQGVSAVLCNTEKGVALVHGVLGETEHGGATYAEIVEGNPALEVSASPHPQRAAFMGALSSGVPIRDMVRRWSFEDSVWLRTKRKLKRLLKL